MTEAEAVIRREIMDRGPMTLARFMELALYAPGVGYYERPECVVGRVGDFYTSVSVGPMFGFLIASRVAAWTPGWERIEVLEAGAHDGRLAADILSALAEHHPACFERVTYHLLEPSPVRRERQRAMLAAYANRVVWHEGWEASTVPAGGVLVANELLDAFPVHRYGWSASERRWYECGVGLSGEQLEWCRLPTGPEFEVPELAEIEPWLRDGWICEQSPAAAAWWRQACRRWRRGWMVTFDYGHEQRWGWRPERPEGSLRAYSAHRVSDRVLADPGGQDLTAHVNFGDLVRVAEQEGWRVETHEPQGRVLTRWAAEILAGGGDGAAWIQSHARQLQTLTHPTHLGQAFRALVQSKGTNPGDAAGSGPE
ncbi:MAG: SAM-dependent methyltransferase [Verrucomicrobiales bacterium]|nr:SAM-dependent methyltransferase [Verrucomicrobiales bacterium]